MLQSVLVRRVNNRQPYTTGICLFIAVLIFSVSARAQTQFNVANGVALSGYDAVAYFTINKATRGSKEFSTRFAGVSYYFSSAQNLDAFKKNPEKYMPQYGGWCAYAMGAKGEKVEVDPETFKIVDGKLYLFYNKFFNNTLNSWNKDEANLKMKADQNWKKLQ